MKYRKWITMICAAFMLCACTSKQPEKKKTNTISHTAKQKEKKIKFFFEKQGAKVPF